MKPYTNAIPLLKHIRKQWREHYQKIKHERTFRSPHLRRDLIRECARMSLLSMPRKEGFKPPHDAHNAHTMRKPRR